MKHAESSLVHRKSMFRFIFVRNRKWDLKKQGNPLSIAQLAQAGNLEMIATEFNGHWVTCKLKEGPVGGFATTGKTKETFAQGTLTRQGGTHVAWGINDTCYKRWQRKVQGPECSHRSASWPFPSHESGETWIGPKRLQSSYNLTSTHISSNKWWTVFHNEESTNMPLMHEVYS